MDVTALHPLVKARARHNLSQRDLADLAGVSPACVAQIEARRRQPRGTTVFRLAVALDAEPEELFPAA